MSKFITNSFQVPNALVDDALIQMSGNATKVYLVVVRKTRGWQKESDQISYSQLKAITGIGSYTTIEKAVAELEALQLVSVKRGTKHQSNTFWINDGSIKDYRNCSTTETVVLQKLERGITETVAGGATETVDTENNSFKTTNQNKKSTPTAKTWLVGLGCSDELAADFITHRKAKNAAITQTALKLMANQAAKAGIPFSRAVEISIQRNWIGFDASWQWQADKPKAQNQSSWQQEQNDKWAAFEQQAMQPIKTVNDEKVIPLGALRHG